MQITTDFESFPVTGDDGRTVSQLNESEIVVVQSVGRQHSVGAPEPVVPGQFIGDGQPASPDAWKRRMNVSQRGLGGGPGPVVGASDAAGFTGLSVAGQDAIFALGQGMYRNPLDFTSGVPSLGFETAGIRTGGDFDVGRLLVFGNSTSVSHEATIQSLTNPGALLATPPSAYVMSPAQGYGSGNPGSGAKQRARKEEQLAPLSGPTSRIMISCARLNDDSEGSTGLFSRVTRMLKRLTSCLD